MMKFSMVEGRNIDTLLDTVCKQSDHIAAQGHYIVDIEFHMTKLFFKKYVIIKYEEAPKDVPTKKRKSSKKKTEKCTITIPEDAYL